jgi:hypothetical protein
MKSYLSDFEMKDGQGKEDYIQCCTVKVKLGQDIDGSVRGVERRMHCVSRGEEKISIFL